MFPSGIALRTVRKEKTKATAVRIMAIGDFPWAQLSYRLKQEEEEESRERNMGDRRTRHGTL
jgi:hypothetical protein